MNNIRKLRQQKGLSQTTVAQAIGISYQSLGLYENEKNKPDPETLCQLADYFGVTVDYLLGREPESGLIYVHKGPELTDEESQLVELYNKLSPTRKHEAIVWLKTMYEIEQESGAHSRNNLGKF